MAWIRGKKITGLFSYGPQNRNCWVLVEDVGWRQLWPSHDCQSEVMAVMAAHARVKQRSVDILEDANKVKTMYVW